MARCPEIGAVMVRPAVRSIAQRADPLGRLPGEGSGRAPPRGALDRPGGGSARDARAATAPPRKRRDREVGRLRVTFSPHSGHYVALTVANRFDELPELACRLAEV